VKGMRTVGEIVVAFRAKHRTIGPTWVHKRLQNYRETGNPNAAPEQITRTSSKDANRSERRFLKKELMRNPVQFYDQLQVKFRRKFKWKISRKKLAAAIKFDGGAAGANGLRIIKHRNALFDTRHSGHTEWMSPRFSFARWLRLGCYTKPREVQLISERGSPCAIDETPH
jgi:hypothetical protein